MNMDLYTISVNWWFPVITAINQLSNCSVFDSDKDSYAVIISKK